MGFLFGVVAGTVGTLAFGSCFRPIAKSAIKSSILLARKVQEIQAEVMEDLSDLKAEADAEMQADEEQKKPAKKK